MSEAPVPQKPIPQYSLRWLLGATTGSAVVCSIVALALRGHVWAVGVSVGLGALVLLMLAQAVFFALVWAWAAIALSRADRSGSPLAGSPASPRHSAADGVPRP